MEGCLSFPNRVAKTVRPQTVTVQALNEYGEEITITGEDEMAKCLCHELEVKFIVRIIYNIKREAVV